MNLRRVVVVVAAVSLSSLVAFGVFEDPPHSELTYFNQCLSCHSPYGPYTDGIVSCMGCHSAETVYSPFLPATPAKTHASSVTETSRFEYALECSACHYPHEHQQNYLWGTDYGKYVRATIEETITVTDFTQTPPEIFTKDVLGYIEFTGPNQFIDGDADLTEDICSTCHTRTNHHRNDGTAPGGQSHFDGSQCTACHTHENGFAPAFGAGGPHPQAVTDCANCHLGPNAEPDLQATHDNNCSLCHVSGFPDTFLGPAGTWGGECEDCHNPGTPETGNRPVPTRGHRCVVCHGQQMDTGDSQSFHEEHTDKANCVVCHGFIPDTGVEIGSGNRDNCHLCHGTDEDQTGVQTLHRKMVREGLSCLECHSGGRPAVDSNEVCAVCHDDEDPSEFVDDPEKMHRRHARKGLDCGFCHADATIQDDRAPMPPVDDARRSMLDRSGFNECVLCHKGGRVTSARRTHDIHVPDQWQWCYNCHEGIDVRPLGEAGPVTQPRESCEMCHRSEEYTDSQPFDIHLEHAGDDKCYACHQAMPRLTDWPSDW